MDPIKIEATNSYYSKRMNPSPPKNNTSNDFMVYIMTALICILVFFITLSNLISLFSSPKSLFIVGNLIVFILLVGESKIMNPKHSQQPASEVYYSEYLTRSQSLRSQRPFTVTSDQNVVAPNECKTLCEVARPLGTSVTKNLPAEELSRRADDFIARVNKQRRLETTEFCPMGNVIM